MIVRLRLKTLEGPAYTGFHEGGGPVSLYPGVSVFDQCQDRRCGCNDCRGVMSREARDSGVSVRAFLHRFELGDPRYRLLLNATRRL